MSAALVLVIDDDRDIRESLAEVLEDEGFEVVGAAHGQEALDKLEQGLSPKVMLLDLMMPVMDGFQFYEHWKSSPKLKAIPLFVVTAGRAQQEQLPEATKFLHKPLELDRLLQLLAEHTR